jgi:ribosome-associated toxin RatA of RatAB toxin-antitoxin module
MPRTALLSLVVGLLLAFGTSASAEARGQPVVGLRASGLSAPERGALAAGRNVARPLRFARGADGWYVGGVSYQVVRATPADVLALVADVRSLPQALPYTESAELVSSTGRTARVELVQGKAPFLARYTIALEQAESGDGIRFWLDPTRPHDVRDVWGFVRVKEFGPGRTLVTVAVALDLGPGLARLFFEDRVERSILRAPAKIREFVEPRALAALP